MLNQEEDVFKEVLVEVRFVSDNDFLVPQAVVNHYSIKGRDGISLGSTKWMPRFLKRSGEVGA